jgi:hypothetical protein
VTYPQSTEYHSAVQNPELCFVDPELKAGIVRTTPLGLPYALSGGFALTYTIESGSKKFAVRCFHREVRDIQSRYEMISKRLKVLNSKFFVDFDYEDKGIKVNNGKYPVVKMRWVEGLTLGDYISKTATNKQKMASLRDQFRELNDFLIQSNIAHGDIQDLNVIVSNDRLVLIDYDGMYVDGLAIGSGNEIGHKDFQHPSRTAKQFGPNMDRFSLILIDLALSIIIERPDLLLKYKSGGEALLFKANDFKDPGKSLLFTELMSIPSLVSSVANFRAVCQAPVDSMPGLRDFLAGRSIPAVSIPSGTPSVSRSAVAGYISSYDVLDASVYKVVAAAVGQKVELIGQIVDVKQGVGMRGRGRGKPYVFVNFGNWQNDCVKLTIWSEGLANFVTMPSSSLVGQWVSVIGLVDPPYEGKYSGKDYRNVGITIERESQIEKITAQEAKYRLASPVAQRVVSSPVPNNRDLLANLKTGNLAPTTRVSQRVTAAQTPTPAPATVSSNQAILASLKPNKTAAAPVPPVSTNSNWAQSKKSQSHQSNAAKPIAPEKESKAWLFWLIGGGLLLLFVLSQ